MQSGFEMTTSGYIVLSLLVLTVITLSYKITMIEQAQGSWARIASAEVGDPQADWHYKIYPSPPKALRVHTFEGLPIYSDRHPISRSECQLLNPQTFRTKFPPPD